MTAMTRSASITPSSMSFASPEASLTLRMGTLRTSMGSGMLRSLLVSMGSGTSFCSAWCGWPALLGPLGDVVTGLDHGACPPLCGRRDLGEAADDGTAAAVLHEAGDRFDLRSHRAAGEVALRRK